MTEYLLVHHAFDVVTVLQPRYPVIFIVVIYNTLHTHRGIGIPLHPSLFI